MIELNIEQMEILEHTAQNDFYCGGSEDMSKLCAMGLMRYVGKKTFVPDAYNAYYAITGKGRKVVRSIHKAAVRNAAGNLLL